MMTEPSGQRNARQIGSAALAAALAAVMCALLHLPLVFTGYWQEDFGFLYAAREGQLIEKFLLLQEPTNFFRPVSLIPYWSVVYHVFGGAPLAAHFLNIIIYGAVVFCVALLGCNFYVQNDKTIPTRAVFWGGLVYGCAGGFFLPLSWASASQELVALLFSSAALLFWARCLDGINLSGLVALLLTLMAFASKEGTLVLPLLAALMAFARGCTNRRAIIWVGIYGGVAFCYYLIHGWLTIPPEEGAPYAWSFGKNVVRNLISLGIFSLNVPREAVRLFLDDRSLLAAGWAALSAILSAAGLFIIVKPVIRQCGWRPIIFTAVFWLAAIVPYLPLTWNSYAYYSLLGLMGLSGLTALAYRGSARQATIGAILWAAGGLIAVSGNFVLPYPSHLARAQWATATHQSFVEQYGESVGPGTVLTVYVGNDFPEHRAWNALGWEEGLAWHLGLAEQQIQITPVNNRDTDIDISLLMLN